MKVKGFLNERLEEYCTLVRWCQSIQNFYYSKNLLNNLDSLLPIFDYIAASKHIKTGSLSNAAQPLSCEEKSKNVVRVSFRMDVDAGIWSAAALANVLKKRHIPIHIFLLHTAEYYGAFDDHNNFIRNPGFLPFLEELKRTEQEIGIHNDMLNIFLKGCDGFSAFTNELTWLRKQEIDITASVAHNSAWAYGAENFELFSGYSNPKRPSTLENKTQVPFGKFTPEALGLQFEGNHPIIKEINKKNLKNYLGKKSTDPIRDPSWLRAHFIDNPIFESAYDTDIWLVGHNLWFIACRKTKQIIFPVSHKGILEYLKYSDSKRIVFNIHPDYIVERDVFHRCAQKQVLFNNNIDSPLNKKDQAYTDIAENARNLQEQSVSYPQKNHEKTLLKSYALLGSITPGSKTLCNFFNTASNGRCQIASRGELRAEAHAIIHGCLPSRDFVLKKTILARAETLAEKRLIYGEHNINLSPFVNSLAINTSFRFILCACDGREIVKALMRAKKNEETSHLKHSAKQHEQILGSLPSPPSSDPYFVRWQNLSYLEKITWHWSHSYQLIFEQLETIPKEYWFQVDCSNLDPATILAAAKLLALEGLEASYLKEAIHKNKKETAPNMIPFEWDEDNQARFECIATPIMQKLGYYSPSHIRFKPPSYGTWWDAYPGGFEWYTWMYDSRLSSHRDFQIFVSEKESQGDIIASVLDVGCGLSIGYSEYFSNKRYLGYDIAKQNIQWCNANRDNPLHAYLEGDIIKKQPVEKFDLVFSQGTIENSYDMNAYLRAMVRSSSKWIYVTGFRGWFPQLKAHRYMWDKSNTCFYNDISPHEVHSLLEELGCTEIEVKPLPMQGAFTHYETRITARVPQKSV